MKRIKVNIKKENKLQFFLNHLEKQMEMFKHIEGVVGITLNGGLSRGYGDHLSEIDLTIYLNQESYKDFNAGVLKFKEGICVIEKILYDIKVVEYNSECQRSMSPFVELWDLNYAKVLYDPKGLIQALIDEKLSSKVFINQIGGPLFDAWWHYRLAGDIWIYREDAIQGHLMLNEAAKSILKSLYIANCEYIPHDKWLVNMLPNLKWIPEEHHTLLEKLFSTGDLTLNSLIKRQRSIDEIWNRINSYDIENNKSCSTVDLTKKSFYERVLSVLQKNSYSIEEFLKICSLRSINSDPFAEFVRIEDGRVIVDKGKFLSLGEESMYSWQYEVVKAVQMTLIEK